MGKYMPKKSKITADVAVMEVVSSSTTTATTTLGVRTRAKTLALQRLNSSALSNGSPNQDATSLCYLQLRSRHIEKPPIFNSEATRKQRQQQTHKEKKKEVEVQFGKKGKMVGINMVKGIINETEEDIEEASCGENNLDFEARVRSTRESTPCSLIGDPDNCGTPCSTTKQTSSSASYRRVQNDVQRHIPTTREMEEFFTSAEQEQQRLFIAKYNFDIVNDLPLPGRYEWAKVNP